MWHKLELFAFFGEIIMYMKHTFFDTFGIKTLFKWFSFAFIKLSGWKIEGELPKDLKKYVMIAVPHTSNWDMSMFLMFAFVFNIKSYWMGKERIFKFPFKHLMKWMGGIPIDRSQTNDVVKQTIDIFNNSEEFIVAIPPEGTRGMTKYWKTGFYHIAHGAGVPIVGTFLDYKRKAGGVRIIFTPTGDLDADMKIIKEHYSNVTGKYPDKFNSEEILKEKN